MQDEIALKKKLMEEKKALKEAAAKASGKGPIGNFLLIIGHLPVT